MSPVGSDDGAVRHALQKVVLQSLQPVFLSLTGLFLFFSYTDGRTLEPAGAARTIAMADIAVALALQALFWPLWRGLVPPRLAHAWALTAALVIVGAVGLSVELTGDPIQTMGLVLVQFGASVFFLSPVAMAAVLVATDLVWLAVALRHGAGSGAWVEWGTVLAASTVVSGVAQALRVRTMRRLEAMRLQDVRTKSELRHALAEAEEATQQAHRSKERFRLVAAATFEGILIHDGVAVLDANPTLGQLLGRDPARLVGRPLADLVDPRDWSECGARLAFPTETPLELRLLRSDGATVRVEVRGRPSPAGPSVAHVLAFRDLSVRDEARQAHEQVKFLTEVNEFKTQFINMASHELRTPLTPIMLQMAVLRQQQSQAPVQQRAVEILHRNLMRLNKLMDDVLDSARIQAARLQVALRTVDLEGLVLDASESFEEAAREHGLSLVVRTEPGLWVQADSDRLHQVMMNFLSNATKFTPQGGSVQVEARREGGDVVVRVTDTGPGIAAEDQPKLFKPFSQLQDTNQSVTQGSGLGLHISRGIIERHGGRIWCESAGAGQGSSFCFALPESASGAA